MRGRVWHSLGWLLIGLVMTQCSGGGKTEGSGQKKEERIVVIDGVTPLSLSASTLQGSNPASLTVTFMNTGACEMDFTVSAKTDDGASWLSVTPVDGTLASESQTLNVSIDVTTTALKSGTYTGALTLEGQCRTNGQPADTKSVSVTLDVLQPPPPSWLAPMTTEEAPSARQGHRAVWTGSSMLIWGGEDKALNATTTGGVYDPANNRWAAMATEGAPVPRQDHTAIWTGSAMIVWGGEDDALEPLATGGVYHLESHQWTPTATDGAPVARVAHTAVWTGSKMLIWGGEDVSAVANTGGAYDPGKKKWSAISQSQAPSTRQGHTAVWTGLRMLIWGGEGGDDVRNDLQATGGAYDPGKNKWSPISQINAPSARQGHTAVWTDSTMLIWGGEEDNAVVNTGGIYDPTGNTWSAISKINAPSARQGHTAVWTGSKMLIWGGKDKAGILQATGGAYDPESNSWSPISQINAPSARQGHTAVWTGSKMLIWGGHGGSEVLQNGGIYGHE